MRIWDTSFNRKFCVFIFNLKKKLMTSFVRMSEQKDQIGSFRQSEELNW